MLLSKFAETGLLRVIRDGEEVPLRPHRGTILLAMASRTCSGRRGREGEAVHMSLHETLCVGAG